ncbi:tyrosine-type recombinase/integrase [Pseudomonas sp. BMS12]|uniref:tyrosine-type recombinase/integrase n=1 Tax=Pseudomonas sp. BMS12 TaxID=1796033 RepID=UPI00083A9642|nr:integrase arm-type DNA-binding domain-containing protein [Pseudomonas sp. BMS12]
MGKLTSKTVEALARAGVTGKTNDGDGLYLQVSKAGASSWIFRYKLDRKSREMGLGPYPAVTLAEARQLAADQRKVLATGSDPLAARDAARESKREAERQAQARRITFETLATEHHQAHGAAWSDRWSKGWIRKMELYAFPVIGKMSAADIQTEHVLGALRPVWNTKPRTADEVRAQIEAVLDAAKARGLRNGDNPARWRGHLENLLSKADKKRARQYQHHPAMHWRDVPALMERLSMLEDQDIYALRLLILTGARSHMVIGASWDEFDMEAGTWSLSAERMKMRKSFIVPLPAQVLELLEAIPRIQGSPYLFPGRSKAGHMYEKAFFHTLRRLDLGGITAHGFRSTFRDWCNECAHFPRQICELALAHDERGQTEAAYSRSDFLEKRRALMTDWATYCTNAPTENVVPIHSKNRA